MRCPSLSDLPLPPAGKVGWPWTEESPRDTLLDGRPWPRVSVVTPSYNQGEYLEEAIRSVLLQGYPDIEYIIMDGGSTDRSVEIIRKYEPWLAHWVSESDQGQTYAINKGWEYTTGEILAYLNSDDSYLAGTINTAADTFLAHPQAHMVYGTALIVDEAGNRLRMWRGEPFDLETMLTVGSIVPQPAAFFRKNALLCLGYLDPRWQMIMDYELCIRMGLQFPTVCIPQILAKFRDHRGSKTYTNFETMAAELMEWLDAFCTDQVSPARLRAIKQETFGRLHYEWALAYLSRGRQHAGKALQHLLKSVLRYPFFALKRPLGTSYIVKEVLLGYVTQMAA